MAGRIEGKVAVVTGGCSGIGLATVERFVEEGAKVVIGDIDDERGKVLADELGGDEVVTYVHVDVTSKDEVDALFGTAKDVYGSVDIAFNNAGISPPDDDSILETDLDECAAQRLRIGELELGRRRGHRGDEVGPDRGNGAHEEAQEVDLLGRSVHAHENAAARLHHPRHLAHAARLVRERHDAEL